MARNAVRTTRSQAVKAAKRLRTSKSKVVRSMAAGVLGNRRKRS